MVHDNGKGLVDSDRTLSTVFIALKQDLGVRILVSRIRGFVITISPKHQPTRRGKDNFRYRAMKRGVLFLPLFLEPKAAGRGVVEAPTEARHRKSNRQVGNQNQTKRKSRSENRVEPSQIRRKHMGKKTSGPGPVMPATWTGFRAAPAIADPQRCCSGTGHHWRLRAAFEQLGAALAGRCSWKPFR